MSTTENREEVIKRIAIASQLRSRDGRRIVSELVYESVVKPLLDELESMTAKRDLWYEKSQDLEAVNKASEKRIADLSKAASVNSQWKPDVCPITGREFFMWIEHPTLGYVPTYGGPFDSYTIPTKGSDGEFSCERYDHDLGDWRAGECLGLYLIDDDENCRIAELETKAGIYDMLREDYNIKGSLAEFVDSQAKRIAELEDENEYIRNRFKEVDRMFGKNILVMQASIIEWRETGNAENALMWIYNTLFGPGELPSENEKDAQAYFNREYAPIDKELMELHQWFYERHKREKAKRASGISVKEDEHG